MTRIYVGGIPSDCRERDLDRFFRNYGRLRDCLIKNGYAFVEFEDSRDADDAVYEMNGRELLGARVSVEHARGIPRRGETFRDRRPAPSWSDRSGRPAARGAGGGYGPPPDARYGPPMRTPYRVLVENLSSRISWQDLKDYMRKEADVTFADAHRHARNVGIVEFASYSDMQRAMDRLDDTELMGRRIKLVDDYNRSRSKSRRRRSRSRSRSHRRRSYSSSRSRSRSRRRSRSRSRSRSRKNTKRSSRSRSQSRSRSKDSAKMSRSRSKSPVKDASKSRSRSRSGSPKREEDDKLNNSLNQNGKRDLSRSRSKTPQSKSRSRSRSPARSEGSPAAKISKRSRSRTGSRSRSGSREYRRYRSGSRSRSRSRSLSGRNGDD
uniref:Serine/arginine-rich splicing factor 5-like n=1 Tax=Hirondellea gigas TaxID=1518452 RepID=A0A2P2I0H1_9CRUS